MPKEKGNGWCYILPMDIEEKRYKEKEGQFSGRPISVWLDTTPETNYKSLPGDIETETLVIGAGIAGLTTAMLLVEEGKEIVLIDSKRIARDVTGNTTAKITSLHGLIYKKLIEKHGESKARLYGEAQQAGLEKIVEIIEKKKIDADLTREPAYTYTEKTENIEKLREEAKAAKKLGLPASFVRETPFPFMRGAVRFDNQAQFHPRKYLLAIAKSISRKKNCQIYENTRALDIIETEENLLVKTNKGNIKAKNVVLATHFPFYDKGRFYARLSPYRSYVIGVRVRENLPEGMFYSLDDNTHSFRTQMLKNGRILLMGGEDHPLGDGAVNAVKYLRKVRSYAKERFSLRFTEYYWDNEDYATADGLPYIGLSPKSKKIYLACGFDGWGMTNGTVAGMMISDMILGKENPWISLFDPSRKDLVKSPGKIFYGGLNFLKSKRPGSVGRKFGLPTGFQRGEARIIEVGGKKVAVYRDKAGEIYKLSPKCTHMDCSVKWNNLEKTWDCPCHGSRFNYDGKVLHGPANEDLKEQET